ncbi:MAG: hypothetical protein N2Z72_03880 [Bacteroidales bacterium]|nr:hypothetical protein [Bacteroidales bacterium]
MNEKKSLVFIFILFIAYLSLKADTIPRNDDPIQAWGDIHFYGFYEFRHKAKPHQGFGLSTGIIGLKKSITNFDWQINGIIMYDVTKTTRLEYTDSSGINSYVEGSHYTAYLKMAEIRLSPIERKWHFSFGQLLGDQYLSFQDNKWGKRYLMTTMQEFYKLGNPADFGVRLGLRSKNDKWYFSLSVLNGDGPFRQQDTSSSLLTSFMTVYETQTSEKKLWSFKAYVDYQPISSTNEHRMAFNLFIQYEDILKRVGVDFVHIMQSPHFTVKPSVQMLSAYLIHRTILPTILFVLRNDIFLKYLSPTIESQYLVGLEWSPIRNIKISFSFRRNTLLNQNFAFIHTGLRF